MNDEARKSLSIGIVCYPTHGGSGVVACELAHGLAAKGHTVHVVSYAVPARLDTLRRGIHFHSVRVPDYPLFEYPPYSLALAARLAEVIDEFNLDILHVHYAIPHAISGWLAKKMTGRNNLPLITTLHGTDITIVGNDPSYLTVTQYSLKKSNAVTVVSKWLGEQVHMHLDCQCETVVVPNFVDTEIYKPDKKWHLKDRLCNTKPIIMHMSNFRPVKRINDVVDTFLRVRKEVPAKLIMIGDGPERASAERKLKESPFASDVQFLGVHNSAEEILACADIFLLPSVAESFGLAALEAMACGVPVVGANVGGLPEVVEDGVSGFLLPAEDVLGMAKACLSLLTDSALLKKMKKVARKSAEKDFQQSVVIDRYEKMYRETIENISSSGA
ncbi:MAG: N-acetyl-alpha-D-glucosaminyl L-malate synthase BshA [Candidatus Electryonea clarkiae]|nr:N-acetyl-alpha-D-glucosaminyl L-malate synthase BshA [Candidatus Electryonea clarkiae]MDP8285498.1 N-acetyl-alpha-D-glucosaminyl L-malate synthase BshA [Candidatus Electryonea clarkiae]